MVLLENRSVLFFSFFYFLFLKSEYILNLIKFEFCSQFKFLFTFKKIVRIQIFCRFGFFSYSKFVQTQNLFKFIFLFTFKICSNSILFIFEICSDSKSVQNWVLFKIWILFRKKWWRQVTDLQPPPIFYCVNIPLMKESINTGGMMLIKLKGRWIGTLLPPDRYISWLINRVDYPTSPRSLGAKHGPWKPSICWCPGELRRNRVWKKIPAPIRPVRCYHSSMSYLNKENKEARWGLIEARPCSISSA
jgi:hypothetical protein